VSAQVYGVFKGENTAYFDIIQLYDDNLSSKYSDDLDTGYLESMQNKDGSVTDYERDEIVILPQLNITTINQQLERQLVRPDYSIVLMVGEIKSHP
jgi:hypothetical protein